MISAQATFQEQLAILKESYARALPGKLEHIAQLWQQATGSPADDGALDSLNRAVHSLSGSGASLGFSLLSTTARETELYLQPFIIKGTFLTGEATEHIEMLLATLSQAASVSDAAAQVVAPSVEAPYKAHGGKSNKVVYLLGIESGLAQDLAAQIGYFGYSVRIFDNTTDFLQAEEEVRPTAVICDIAGPGTSVQWHDIDKDGQPPVIFVSGRDDIDARLYAVRAGAVAYFTRPVGIDSIISKLDELSSPHEMEPFRILVVDDEPELAKYHASILQSAGMLTTVINDPILTLTALRESKPDLILIDMHMPGCTGLELASVIRQQEAYVSVPIVYLSAEQDVDKQLAAMRLGADSFLTKPIQPEHLVSAVLGRVERLRVLRSFMVRDSLTGLLNHTVLKEQLAVEVTRAARLGTDMSFVMVDIDKFKLVNDTYGHPVGDQVIKSISRLLQQRLRKTDILGRYGGEEFAIILPDTKEAQAVKLLNTIRESFSQVRQQSEAHDFYATFSAGVASFSQFAGANELNNAADRALYKAKALGRNCVVGAAGEG